MLLRNAVNKLPNQYRIMWGNYTTDLRDIGEPSNVDTFNVWVRRQAEITSATSQSRVDVKLMKPNENTKFGKPDRFQRENSNETSRI